jgi:decaprenylphospho-beta-D-erythro-pentofuranosid-2-ulose 2-reductase
VRNALGAVQSLLVLGGSSDIGAAIAERLVPDGCRTVVLAGRRLEAMDPVARRLRAAGAAAVITIHWDAVDIGAHADAVKAAWDAAAVDIDCVVLASGVLGEQSHLEDDPAAAAELAATNYAGPVSALLHVARRSNFVYGSSKAGLDAFAQGLADSLVAAGVRVVVVRPGFVRSSMTEGRDDAPLATTPAAVAEAVAAAIASGQETVWVPGAFRYVMSALRHLPRPVWRRVSANM